MIKRNRTQTAASDIKVTPGDEEENHLYPDDIKLEEGQYSFTRLLNENQNEDNDDPEKLQQAEVHKKRLEIRQKQIDEQKAERFRLNPGKSLARNWIEGLRTEIDQGRFDEERLSFRTQEKVQDYIDEISCKIKTAFLYKVKLCQSTNALGEYCPVLCSLVDNNFIDLAGLKGQDMLKIFHKSGVCVYQRAIADMMLKHARMYQDNFLMRVATDYYLDTTTKKDPKTKQYISMKVDVLTLVQLSIERQTHIKKIFCLEYPSLQFCADFAVYNNKGVTEIHLLFKKPGDKTTHDQKFQWEYVILVPMENMKNLQRKNSKKVQGSSLPFIKTGLLDGPENQQTIEFKPPEPRISNPDNEVVYVEYVKKYPHLVLEETQVPVGIFPFQDCGYTSYEQPDEKKKRSVVTRHKSISHSGQFILQVDSQRNSKDSQKFKNEQSTKPAKQKKKKVRTVHEQIILTVTDMTNQEARVNFLKPHENSEKREIKLISLFENKLLQYFNEEENGQADVEQLKQEASNRVSHHSKSNLNEILKVLHGMFKEEHLDEDDDQEDKRFNITVAQRRNCVDFYINYRFLTSIEHEVSEIKLTFRNLYLILKAPDNNKQFLTRLQTWKKEENPLLYAWVPKDVRQRYPEFSLLPDEELVNIAEQTTKIVICRVKLNWQTQISSSVLDPIYGAGEDYWKKIVQKKVSDYARFYNSFCQQKTFVFVSHDRFVSIFNLSSEKWIYHQNLHDEVREIWTISSNQKSKKVARETGFLISLLCVVGAGAIKNLQFTLPTFSKDKASNSQPQITVYVEKMTAAQKVEKWSTIIRQNLHRHLALILMQAKAKRLEGEIGKKEPDGIVPLRRANSEENLEKDLTKSPLDVKDEQSFLRLKSQKPSKPSPRRKTEAKQKNDKLFTQHQASVEEKHVELRCIHSVTQNSKHAECVVAVVEEFQDSTQLQRDVRKKVSTREGTNSKLFDQRQVLRYLANPLFADFVKTSSGHLMREHDEVIMKKPEFMEHNKMFRYNTLMMECVRRNPVTYKDLDVSLLPQTSQIPNELSLVMIKSDGVCILELFKEDKHDSTIRKKFKIKPKHKIVTDAIKVGKHNFIVIYIIDEKSVIQYTCSEQDKSLYKTLTFKLNQNFDLADSALVRRFKNVKLIQEIYKVEEKIKELQKWIDLETKDHSSSRMSKIRSMRLTSSQANMAEILHAENSEDSNKYEKKEEASHNFIFVNEGRVQNLVADSKLRLSCRYQSDQMNIVAAENIDMFLYCLCTNSIRNESGVYIYGLDQMLKKNPTNFKVKILESLVGANQIIQVDSSRKRFSYMRDYDNLMQMPIIHTNIISFAGMPELKGRPKHGHASEGNEYEILICRVVDQRFFALTTEEELYEWDINSGKLIQVIKMADLRTRYYCLTEDPVQHFEEYSIKLLIEKEEFVHQNDADANYASTKGTKGTKERTFRILKMSKEPQQLECEVVNHLQFKLRFAHEASRSTFIVKNDENSEQGQTKQLSLPQLKFSPDLQQMLLINRSGACVIYKQYKTKEHVAYTGGNITIAEWQPQIFIMDLQPELLWRSRQLSLFTPDFKYYIDYDFNKFEWSVNASRNKRETGIVEAQSETIVIPSDFLSTVFKDESANKDTPELIASRMHLISANHIRIINDDGVDCIFNFRSQIVETFAKVPGMCVNSYPDKQFFLDKDNRIPFSKMAQMRNVTKRIITLNNEFIQAASLKAELQDNYITEYKDAAYEQTFISKAITWHLFTNNISKMNFQYDEEINFYRYYVEKSFVLLDWVIIEMILNDTKFRNTDFENIPRAQKLRICYNILPTQTSLIHMLAGDQFSEGGNTDLFTKSLFEVCNDQSIIEDYQYQRHQMPFFDDRDGRNPFDHVLQLKVPKSQQGNLGLFNKTLSVVLFQGYKDHEFMSFTRSISRAFPKAVQFEVSEVGEFLEARLQHSKLLWSTAFAQNWLRRGTTWTNKLFCDEATGEQQFAETCATSPWPFRTVLERTLFNKVKGENTAIDQADVQVSTRFCDIPFLHNSHRQESRDFFTMLSNTQMIELFGTKTIQSIIAHRWRANKTYLVLGQLLPYILFQVAFVFYNSFVVNHLDYYWANQQGTQADLIQEDPVDIGYKFWLRWENNPNSWFFSPIIYLVNKGVLAICAVYFLFISIMNLIRTPPMRYIENPWDFITGLCNFLVPGVLMLVFLGLRARETGILKVNKEPLTTAESQILGYCSIMLWMNLIYFGRMWDQTGVFIVLFRKFTGSVTNFIVLMLALTFVVADIFYLLGKHSNKIDEETGDYMPGVYPSFYDASIGSLFYGILGQDDISKFTDQNSEIIMTVIWFILSIIVFVILVNLLIAVIGWLYEESIEFGVQSNQLSTTQLLANLQNLRLYEKRDTQIKNKFLVASFYPSLGDEVDARQKFFVEATQGEIVNNFLYQEDDQNDHHSDAEIQEDTEEISEDDFDDDDF